MSAPSRPRRRSLRAAVALVAVLASLPAHAVSSSSTPNSFSDRFNEVGPLQGSTAADPYEIRNGDWKVTDQINLAAAGTDPVLQQTKLDSMPNEPMVFVREHDFRSMTAQVTAAFIGSDQTSGTSVGLVFRAPVFDTGATDVNNMYFFGGFVTGVTRDYPSGKVYALFKRFGRSWYQLNGIDANKVPRTANTWADLTSPHQYKVVMAYNRIQAYVDGRKVIDHIDRALGDQPTSNDPLPGLPYEVGTVGLRTTGTRAWFDDLSVVANDGYEGRAMIGDAFVEGGRGDQTKKGATQHLSASLSESPAGRTDTGFVLSDSGFDSALVQSLSNPSAGPNVRTNAGDGIVTSQARANGLRMTFVDPTGTTTVTISADKIEATARATCSDAVSEVKILNGVYHVRNVDSTGRVLEVGPSPIANSPAANTVLFASPGVPLRITLHARHDAAPLSRVTATAIMLEVPQQRLKTEELSVQQVPGARLPTSDLGETPTIEIPMAHVVAGRYCY